MKKTLLILAIVLIGVFVALTAVDLKGSYNAEKELWKINQEMAIIAQDPKASPEASYMKVYNRYVKFYNHFSDSKLAPVAHVLSGRVYFFKGNYDKARSIFEEVLTKYGSNEFVGINTLMEIVNTYSQQEDTEGMIRTYRRIQSMYPFTPAGLKVPITVADYYKQSKNTAKATQEYKNSINYYKKLIAENEDERVVYLSNYHMSTAYLELGEWEEGLSLSRSILLDFPNTDLWDQYRFMKLIKTINTISVLKYNSIHYPVAAYEEFMKKYPDHPFNASLQGIIKGLIKANENVQKKEREAAEKQQ